MVSKKSRSEVRVNKHRKLRNRFSGTAERPRLAVFRSNNHMYAQIIDDTVGKTLVSALRGVSLYVERGEFLAIVGPSGSGKTTLLNLIGCIEHPTTGAVLIDNRTVSELSGDALAQLRADSIGFVFQHFNLLPVLTALENVEYPLLLKRLSARERRTRAEQALENVGLAATSRHKPLELSGGQQQRVAIARAIVTDPLLVLADEPTANLDRSTGLEILNLMQAINRRQRTTFVFSTHDPKIMERAGRVVTLSDGLVVS